MKVTAIIEGLGVEDHQTDCPSEEGFIVELDWLLDNLPPLAFNLMGHGKAQLTEMLTHFSLDNALYSFCRTLSGDIVRLQNMMYFLQASTFLPLDDVD